MSRALWQGVLIMVLLVCGGVTAGAADYYVATNGTHASPFDTWIKAATNIQAAVNAAGDNDRVWVSNGVYAVAASNTTVVTINTKTLELRAFSGNPADTIIDGSGTNRGVYIFMTSPKVALVDGFTITNCSIGDCGGGVRLTHTSITSGTGIVQNCVISGNLTRDSAGYNGGGGLYSRAANPSAFLTVVSNCTISGNSAKRDGGGGVALYFGRVLMQDCRVFNNTTIDGSSGVGGGIRTSLSGEDSVIRNCVVSNNNASYFGAGIYLSNGPRVENCTMRNNAGPYGVGLFITGSALTNIVRNSLICYNTASSYAAGGEISDGYALLENCTIVSNSTPSTGSGYKTGGLYVTGATTSAVQNTIIFWNYGGGGSYSNYNANGGTVSFSYTCVGVTAVPAGTGNTSANPQFMNVGGGYFGLTIGSPCVNTGTNHLEWMSGAVDMAANPRIDSASGLVDMGCYECIADWVGATNFYVATNGPNLYPYNSWDRAATNIPTVVLIAPNNARVWVSNGVYASPVINSTVVTIDTKSLELRGFSGNPADTIIDGSGTNRGIYITMSSPKVTLIDGFTITNCSVADYGAGVRLAHTGITSGTGIVQNCVISGNTVRDSAANYGGAGLYSRGANPSAFLTVVSNCTIAGNWANYDGGGANFYYARVLMQDCRILGNTANGSYREGGGLFTCFNSEDSVVRNCLVEGNTASYFGAGILLWVGPRIENCTIQRNSGPYGVGLYVTGSARTNVVRNCLIRYNQAMSYAAGLEIDGAYCLLESCTIVSNVTPSSGSGYRTGGLEFTSSSTGVVQNSIIYLNYGGGGGYSNMHVSSSAVFLNSCIGPPPAGTGNTGSNPLFADALGGDFRVIRVSPCVNTGTNQDWMFSAIDLDGNCRIDRQGLGNVDMGCYEFPFDRGAIFSIR